jgi:outer membrane receptor protein involved in Fe transport
VLDEQEDAVIREGTDNDQRDFEDVGYFGRNDWGKGTFKIGMEFSGFEKDLEFSSYLSFGLNTKFPTLYQQLSSPASVWGSSENVELQPEKNRSIELGFRLGKDIRGEQTVYGWTVSGTFFQNHYDDKIRVSSTPGIPVSFFDTVPDARITGFEGKWNVFFFRKKLGLELGLSKYFISEKSAFPFKSDSKRTLNVIVEHLGYNLQAHLFGEGDQIGWIRDTNGRFVEIILPSYQNLDLHLSKTFRFYRLEIFLNASARNVLKGEEVVLRGLAIRDRRYYLTLGIQY